MLDPIDSCLLIGDRGSFQTMVYKGLEHVPLVAAAQAELNARLPIEHHSNIQMFQSFAAGSWGDNYGGSYGWHSDGDNDVLVCCLGASPELKSTYCAWVFCMSWSADCEFWVTHRRLTALQGRPGRRAQPAHP